MSSAVWESMSNTLLTVALVIDAVALVAFAAAFSLRRPPQTAPVSIEIPAQTRAHLVKAAYAGTALPPHVVATARHHVHGSIPAGRVGPADKFAYQRFLSAGMGIFTIGWVALLGSIAARVAQVHRAPWGNMYEFSCSAAAVASAAFLLLAQKKAAVRAVGIFVVLPIVLYLGLAGVVLYVPAGPLPVVLQSYWLQIHVAAAIVASGLFFVAGVFTVLYLMRLRFDHRFVTSGKVIGSGGRLPAASRLDQLQLRLIVFAFPVWTFAIVAGAIWAEAAWGHYWSWDPKETSSLITWLAYAAFLQARATVGWIGRRAGFVALLAFIALLSDYLVTNLFIVGMHSFSGL